MSRRFVGAGSSIIASALLACGGGDSQEVAAAPRARPVDVVPAVEPAPGTEPVVEVAPVEGGPAWLDGTPPEDLPSEQWVLGAAVGETDEAAFEAALDVLALALLGPVEQRPDGEAPAVYVAEGDHRRDEVVPDGRVAVLLAVERSVFAMRVAEWLERAPASRTSDASTPTGMLEAALTFYRYQHRQAFACERQLAIAGSDCEPLDTAMARKQVAAVAASIKLESAFVGGIPFRDGDPPLRPAAVLARWRNGSGDWVAWQGLPIRFVADEGVLSAEAAVTDAEGHASVEFATGPHAAVTLRATVDREALLGRSATLWPNVEATLPVRAVSLTSGRVAVSWRDEIMDDQLAESATSSALVRGLKDLGFGSAAPLSPEDGTRLSAASKGERARVLLDIATRSRAMVDQVVIGEARSEFAGRMGARSVWHEATGTLTIYDVWSGEALGTIERSARARGTGDANAGRKALRQLGTAMAEAVHEMLTAKASASAEL